MPQTGQNTPSQRLANEAVERLVRAGLVLPRHRDEAQEALGSGKAKAADWLLWVDLAQGADREGSAGGRAGGGAHESRV